MLDEYSPVKKMNISKHNCIQTKTAELNQSASSRPTVYKQLFEPAFVKQSLELDDNHTSVGNPSRAMPQRNAGQ